MSFFDLWQAARASRASKTAGEDVMEKGSIRLAKGDLLTELGTVIGHIFSR
jgi:hypothetical protein